MSDGFDNLRGEFSRTGREVPPDRERAGPLDPPRRVRPMRVFWAVVAAVVLIFVLMLVVNPGDNTENGELPLIETETE